MVANVKSEWVDGDLVFKNAAGSTIMTLKNGDASLAVTTLSLDPQLDFIADTADIDTDVTVEKINAIIADINAIKDAFVDAGLMAPSA